MMQTPFTMVVSFIFYSLQTCLTERHTDYDIKESFKEYYWLIYLFII